VPLGTGPDRLEWRQVGRVRGFDPPHGPGASETTRSLDHTPLPERVREDRVLEARGEEAVASRAGPQREHLGRAAEPGGRRRWIAGAESARQLTEREPEPFGVGVLPDLRPHTGPQRIIERRNPGPRAVRLTEQPVAVRPVPLFHLRCGGRGLDHGCVPERGPAQLRTRAAIALAVLLVVRARP